MEWNISSECISAIIILIILIYSSGTNAVPTPRNQMFKICLHVTYWGILINVLSVILIVSSNIVPLWINEIVNSLFFAFSALIPLSCVAYLLTLLYENNPNKKRLQVSLSLLLAVLVIHAVIVGTNAFTKMLFYFDEHNRYVRGYFNEWLYILTVFILLICMVFYFIERKNADKALAKVIFQLPLISLSLLAIQAVQPDQILSGTAAMLPILIVYLNFQNKRITSDYLTGFSNRETFVNMLNYNIKKQEKMSVLILSLDSFKLVNNKFGQKNGDELIISVGEYVSTLVPVKCIYRYGGDEFAVILSGKYYNLTKEFINKLVMRFNKAWSINGIEYRISAGIANVLYPNYASNTDEIINFLEYAIKKGKQKGKGQVIIFDENLQDSINRRNRVIHSLKTALEKDQFEINYQPVYNLESQEIFSAEALLRLKDPDLGLISPYEFIPIAEEEGLITEIGYMVLEKVCGFISHMNSKSVRVGSISINFSSQQLFSDRIIRRTLEIIHKYHVAPSQIKIEITESNFIEQFEYISTLMKRFNKEGIKFYLDDFGTGYSNFSYVMNLPFECIKFDKSFICDFEGNDKRSILIEALARGFKQNGVKIIAEGVETKAQAEFLKNVSCDFVQGFLFSKAMTPEKFERKLSENQIP